MTTWTHYTLTYDDTGHQVEVLVSDAPETQTILQEINSFWSQAEDRLREANGDVTAAVLKMLCTEALRETVTAVNPFDPFLEGKMEGWPALDGSCGIKLLSLEYFYFDGSVSIASRPYVEPVKADQNEDFGDAP